MNIELGQDFELDGFWFLPSSPELRKSGKLTWRSGEGIRLHLRGDFHREDTRLDLIAGKTYDGLPCTLIDNYFIGPAIGSLDPDAPHFFYSTYLALGRKFNKRSELRASSVSVAFSFLDHWLGFSPLSAGYPVDQISGDDWGDLQIFFERPEQISLSLPSINSTLVTEYQLITSYGKYEPARQSFTPYLKLSPVAPKDLSWFQEQIWYIQQFLTLLSGKPVRAKRIRFDFDPKASPGWELFSSSAIKDDSRIVHPSVLLIRRKEIGKEFEPILNRWFETYKKLDTVIGLFLGVSYNPNQYITSNFLNLTQALEAYHRHLDQDTYISLEEYKALLGKILPSLQAINPPELRDSLRSKLNYGNELSLRSRLKLILKNLDSPRRELITEDRNEFVNKVVDTRNYYTHYDRSLAEKAAKDQELIELNKHLKALIMFVLFDELEISHSIQKSAIEKFLNPPLFYSYDSASPDE